MCSSCIVCGLGMFVSQYLASTKVDWYCQHLACGNNRTQPPILVNNHHKGVLPFLWHYIFFFSYILCELNKFLHNEYSTSFIFKQSLDLDRSKPDHKSNEHYQSTHSFRTSSSSWFYFTMATFSLISLFVALRLFLLISAAPTPASVPQVNAAAASSYWLSSIARTGTVAFGDSAHQVFRNVKDFGAKGDGT